MFAVRLASSSRADIYLLNAKLVLPNSGTPVQCQATATSLSYEHTSQAADVSG